MDIRAQSEPNRLRSMLRTLIPPIVAVSAAVGVGCLLIAAVGLNVPNALSAAVHGGLGTSYGLSVTLTTSTPILLTALGMVIAFRCGLFNVGAEGQMYLGGLASVLIDTMHLGLGPVFQITLSLLAAFVAGGVWAAIPGYLKAVRNTNIIITTLLLNYVGQYLISFLVHGPMRAVVDNPYADPHSMAVLYKLPVIWPGTELNIGFPLAILAVLFFSFLLFRTGLGVEFRVIGSSPKAAVTSGINMVSRTTLAMMISGGLAGLGGAVEIMGVQYRLLDGFVSGMGYTGIVVAILGGTSPVAVFPAALLFGFLDNASTYMQQMAAVPNPIISVIEGVIVLFLSASFVVTTVRRRRHLVSKDEGAGDEKLALASRRSQ